MKSKKNDISEVVITCRLDATFVATGADARKLASATNEQITECFKKTIVNTTGADDISVKDLKVFITK